MQPNKLIAIAAAVAQFVLAPAGVAGATVDNRGTEITGTEASTDSAIAAERTCGAIIERMVLAYRTQLSASNIDETAFRGALLSLPADQLLAASLSDHPHVSRFCCAKRLS